VLHAARDRLVLQPGDSYAPHLAWYGASVVGVLAVGAKKVPQYRDVVIKPAPAKAHAASGGEARAVPRLSRAQSEDAESIATTTAGQQSDLAPDTPRLQSEDAESTSTVAGERETPDTPRPQRSRSPLRKVTT
jgi:hypothetical protein